MKQEQWRFDQEAEKWNVSGGITYEEEENFYDIKFLKIAKKVKWRTIYKQSK